MNIAEHKKLLRNYELVLNEILHLKIAQETPPTEWWITTYQDKFRLPVPREYAEKILHEQLLALELEAKNQAAKLGIDA